jgi:DNA-directed RNA polymerase sigma subunit (sigma70/sigma32)
MGGQGEQTLEEVARHFGCTRENIRLLQVSALRKMRMALLEMEKGRRGCPAAETSGQR